MNRFKLILVIIITILLGGGVYVYSRNSTISGLIYGSEKAPVEVINFTSFQCPPCATFHEKFGKILESYMESGDVKLIVKPLDISKFEFDEIIYLRLNEKQINSYSELVKIYSSQSEWKEFNSKDDVVKLLRLENNINKKLEKDLKINIKEKNKLGMDSVPTTFINGEKMSEEMTPEQFEMKILELIR